MLELKKTLLALPIPNSFDETLIERKAATSLAWFLAPAGQPSRSGYLLWLAYTSKRCQVGHFGPGVQNASQLSIFATVRFCKHLICCRIYRTHRALEFSTRKHVIATAAFDGIVRVSSTSSRTARVCLLAAKPSSRLISVTPVTTWEMDSALRAQNPDSRSY